jgi:hypothetical protein
MSNSLCRSEVHHASCLARCQSLSSSEHGGLVRHYVVGGKRSLLCDRHAAGLPQHALEETAPPTPR